jgi:hypothetical protein
MMATLCARSALALAAAGLIAMGTAAAGEPLVTNFGPPGYGFLALRSGHTYKFLNAGPLFGAGGKRFGLALAYASDTTDRAKLESAAEELFEYLRAIADLRNEDGVLVMAQLNYEPGQANSTTENWGVVFKKDVRGNWSRLRSQEDPPHSLPRRASHAEVVRDPEGERAALADAEAWLALFDVEKYAETWEAAAPFLKGFASKERWVTRRSAVRPEFGKLVSRSRIATLSTRFVPGAPPASYVVLEYRSKYEKKPDSFERITEMHPRDL